MSDTHRPEVRAIPVTLYCPPKKRAYKWDPETLQRVRADRAKRRLEVCYRGQTEMDLYDSMHPRCRAALESCVLNFDLKTMPAVALYWATAAPTRFLAWLDAEVAYALNKESP